MDANQLAEALSRAVEAAKPPQEYCFLFVDFWPMCMTKAEWSGWMQAIGAVAAILAVWWQTTSARREHATRKMEQLRDLTVRAAILVRDLGALAHKSSLYAAAISTGSVSDEGIASIGRTLSAAAAPIAQVRFFDLAEQEIAFALYEVSGAVSELQLALEFDRPKVYPILLRLAHTCATASETFRKRLVAIDGHENSRSA